MQHWEAALQLPTAGHRQALKDRTDLFSPGLWHSFNFLWVFFSPLQNNLSEINMCAFAGGRAEARHVHLMGKCNKDTPPFQKETVRASACQADSMAPNEAHQCLMEGGKENH